MTASRNFAGVNQGETWPVFDCESLQSFGKLEETIILPGDAPWVGRFSGYDRLIDFLGPRARALARPQSSGARLVGVLWRTITGEPTMDSLVGAWTARICL